MKNNDSLFNFLQKQPLVSILTPCRNSATFLERCIKSVISQDYPYVEHIIQDNCSTDETLHILKKYGKNVNWKSEEDQGQSDGLNRALQRCQGEVIGVLNADDEYLPQTISSAVQNLNKYPQVACVYGRQMNVDAEGNFLFMSQGPEPYNFFKIFCCKEVIPAQAAFIRRAALEHAGFYVDVTRPTCPDYEMWIRLGLKFKMQHISEVLAYYRIHSGSEGQQEKIIHKMVESKLEVVNRYCQDSDVPLHIRKLKRCAYAGIYEWSALHFLPPLTSGKEKVALKQLIKSLLFWPRMRVVRLIIIMILGARFKFFKENFQTLAFVTIGEILKKIIHITREVGRKIDLFLFRGLIYKTIYLPAKQKIKNLR